MERKIEERKKGRGKEIRREREMGRIVENLRG